MVCRKNKKDMKVCDIKNLNILYVAPRYHTNQVPIMRGWHENNCRVMFMAEYEGVSEVHDYVEFYSLKQSVLSKIISKFIERKYSSSEAEWKKVKLFIPNVRDTVNTIKKFNPDLVILRDRHLTNMLIYYICRMLKINKCILYVQEPICGNMQTESLFKRYIKKLLFPSVVFSPVLYFGKVREVSNASHMWFVPLVAEKGDKTFKIRDNYFSNGTIHFLDVGKYREYKNHFFLVDVFEKIKSQIKGVDIKLTIIGQLSNSDEEEYYTRLKDYIKEKALEDVIETRKNIPFREMKDLYTKQDVLLLPSTYESAGMVILEAMENGLCVVASIYCGLSSYLEEYQCGYTFDIKDTTDLEKILLDLINQKELIRQNGNKGIEIIRKKLCFENYVQALNKLTEKEFDFSILG